MKDMKNMDHMDMEDMNVHMYYMNGMEDKDISPSAQAPRETHVFVNTDLMNTNLHQSSMSVHMYMDLHTKPPQDTIPLHAMLCHQ